MFINFLSGSLKFHFFPVLFFSVTQTERSVDILLDRSVSLSVHSDIILQFSVRTVGRWQFRTTQLFCSVMPLWRPDIAVSSAVRRLGVDVSELRERKPFDSLAIFTFRRQ